MTFENLGEHLVLLATAVATSVFGVSTINGYRREVVRQRELNQYRLGRKLGAGGMGEVYLAEHRLLKRPCAMKLIAPKLTGSETSRARFELEVRATARLSHWNTVEVYDYGRTEDGEFYYVMEYLPGLSLQEVVDRHGPMPAGRVIYLLRQVCEALREAHLAGLIHRDLKPPNVFAALRGARYDVAKVLDFGLVKSVGDESSPHLTLEGIVTGSPLYMAPEMILKNRVPDGRVDVYSLGAVAYFLLTGRPPFLGPDAISVMMAHANDLVELMTEHNPDVPFDLEAVVLRCLEKDPGDRYASASDLSRALGGCRDADGWSADRAEAWWMEHEPIAPGTEAAPVEGPRVDVLPSLDVLDFPGVDDPTALSAGPPDPLNTIGEEPEPPSRAG
nr:serine/threonine-protein kinase [Paludisphaera mucosa]